MLVEALGLEHEDPDRPFLNEGADAHAHRRVCEPHGIRRAGPRPSEEEEQAVGKAGGDDHPCSPSEDASAEAAKGCPDDLGRVDVGQLGQAQGARR